MASDNWKVENGDCLQVLRTMDAASVDAVVTDPPYGLAFMGKKWDHDVPTQAIWEERLRVLKPGGHLLAFFGTRTYHRAVVRIEDAGFDIRDCIAWVYGSGFPKSLDVSKAIDKAAGAKRKVIGSYSGATNIGKACDGKRGYGHDGTSCAGVDTTVYVTEPATDSARQWSGWGTALKPAMEPIVVARKPLDGTVAANVQEYGTGAINVDGCRVGTDGGCKIREGSGGFNAGTVNALGGHLNSCRSPQLEGLGRWPANLIHDGSEEASEPLGDAARYFYCAKASKADREDGALRDGGVGALRDGGRSNTEPRANHHPTVKPTDLMRYLCRLVTPPNGVVLDPFCGSGSTGKAAMLEGFRFVGIEREPEYVEIARARIGKAERDASETLAAV